MYPDLSYLVHALTGIEPDNGLSIVKTFGLMLIMAFLASAYFLRLELIRKRCKAGPDREPGQIQSHTRK